MIPVLNNKCKYWQNKKDKILLNHGHLCCISEIYYCTVNGKKKQPEAETGIFSHDVSLNMVRDLFVGGIF